MASLPPNGAIESNPFSSRSVRPGVLPYLFPDGTTPRELVARLRDAGWRAQIIGPHGSGKSTLLETLQPELYAGGREVFSLTLRDGQRRLPGKFSAQLSEAAARPGRQAVALVMVDGYEQLGFLSRAYLRWLCRSRGWGLLVTAHRGVGLPTLWQTSVDAELAAAIVGRLVPSDQPSPSRDELAAALARHDGNLRHVLFEQYDAFERRRRQGPMA